MKNRVLAVPHRRHITVGTKGCPRLAIFPAFITILLLSTAAYGQIEQASSTWNVLPGQLRPATGGKYPLTQTLKLSIKNCQRDSTGKWSLAGYTFTVSATGNGIQLASANVGDCYLTVVATFDPAIQPDSYDLMVFAKAPQTGSTSTDVGFATFNVLSSLAGPTPSTPEVDVLWKVLSNHACSDTFGNHVANVFYCAQVTIGNNSAYKLQISGIGFKGPDLIRQVIEPKNTDATETIPATSYRTTRAVAQTGQTSTARNLLYNGIGATGLIMAAFTPYFHNPKNVARWSTGASIVGSAFTSAINLVAPDLTIRELNNLDDQSLRDGLVIPNNTQQAPFDVFIDKRDIGPRMNALYTTFKKAAQTDDVGQQKLLSELESCVKKHSKHCDPELVKKAIGDLVLIGNQVDYLQRIVVDTSTQAAQGQTPAVTNGNQVSVAATGTPITLSFTGTGLSQVTQAQSSDPGVTPGSITHNPDGSISVPITVPTSFQGPDVSVVLSSPTGDVTVAVPVGPYVSNASTLSVTADGQAHQLALTGNHLNLITGASLAAPDPNISIGTLQNATPSAITLPITVKSGYSGKSITVNLQWQSGSTPLSISVQKAGQ